MRQVSQRAAVVADEASVAPRRGMMEAWLLWTEEPMITATNPKLRFRGSGEHLRLRLASTPDPLATVHECCRASVALEKALGEAIREAIATGHSWAEVGQALRVDAETSVGVQEAYEATGHWMRSKFWHRDGDTS